VIEDAIRAQGQPAARPSRNVLGRHTTSDRSGIRAAPPAHRDTTSPSTRPPPARCPHTTLGNNVLLRTRSGWSLTPGSRGTERSTSACAERATRDRRTLRVGRIRSRGCTAASHGRLPYPGPPDTPVGVCTGQEHRRRPCARPRHPVSTRFVVGEGPHHTAVAADDIGLIVVYVGHYATETLGFEHSLTTHDDVRSFRPRSSAAPTGL
jgi:hypothetical protein